MEVTSVSKSVITLLAPSPAPAQMAITPWEMESVA